MAYVPQQTDIPSVRSIDDSSQVPLAAAAPYERCLALIPDTDVPGQWNVALYLGSQFPSSVPWAPPPNTVVIDLPQGFSIQVAGAILHWLQTTPPAGPGGVGTVAVTSVYVGESVAPQPNPGSAAQSTDIPNVRSIGVSGRTPLAPRQGYQGCIAVFPYRGGADGQMNIVLYLDSSLGQSDAEGNLIPGTGPGIPWDCPDGTVIIDLPQGFCINDASAIGYWMNRAPGGGDEPHTGPIGGD